MLIRIGKIAGMLWLAALVFVSGTSALHAYPLDGYEKTGILIFFNYGSRKLLSQQKIDELLQTLSTLKNQKNKLHVEEEELKQKIIELNEHGKILSSEILFLKKRLQKAVNLD